MALHISIWDRKNEEQILFKTDLSSNPFSVGDIIELKVKNLDLDLPEFRKYPNQVKVNFETNHEKYKNLYHLKNFKIVEIRKFIDIGTVEESTITIECYADEV